MIHNYDDWSAPFPVRTLRWLREELAEVERKIPDARRRYIALITEREALKYAIADNERYLREINVKGDDANE